MYIWHILIIIYTTVYMQHEHWKNVLTYFWKKTTKKRKGLVIGFHPKGAHLAVSSCLVRCCCSCAFSKRQIHLQQKLRWMLRLRLDIWMDSHKGSFSYLYWAWKGTAVDGSEIRDQLTSWYLVVNIPLFNDVWFLAPSNPRWLRMGFLNNHQTVPEWWQ